MPRLRFVARHHHSGTESKQNFVGLTASDACTIDARRLGGLFPHLAFRDPESWSHRLDRWDTRNGTWVVAAVFN